MASYLLYLGELLMSDGDPRTDGWFMMSNPIQIIFMLAVYVYFANKAPKMLENYKALKLKWVLIIYNFSLVGLSIYMFKEILITSYKSNYSYTCQPVDYSDDPLSLRMANVIYVFFVSKVIEVLDTVFFILRKKQEQITVLHIYHHTSMITIYWGTTKWLAGGQSFFAPLINSFTHIFVYSYYALSAFGPSMQPYLWWKKYLTQMQLLQFWLIIIHLGLGIYNGCRYPAPIMFMCILYLISMTGFFLNYYFHAFLHPQKAAPKKIN